MKYILVLATTLALLNSLEGQLYYSCLSAPSSKEIYNNIVEDSLFDVEDLAAYDPISTLINKGLVVVSSADKFPFSTDGQLVLEVQQVFIIPSKLTLKNGIIQIRGKYDVDLSNGVDVSNSYGYLEIFKSNTLYFQDSDCWLKMNRARDTHLRHARTSLHKSAQPSSSSTRSSSTYSSRAKRSTYRRYYRGPRGGCYYINSNGNKTYVDRSLCN